MIAKIIHQTARNKCISWEERHLIKRAKKLMPDYEFRFYDDNDNQRLVEKYFPQYIEKYNSINKGVAKADIARLIYMYVFGGWYCDTDYKWIKRPDYILKNTNCKIVLPISREDDNIFRLGNAVFGSEQRHPFWKDFIDYIFQSSELTSLKENRIEKVTGPEGLTEFYLKNKGLYKDVLLPNKKYFHPKLKSASAIIEKDTIGVHLCWASWRTGKLTIRLRNMMRRKISAIV